MVTSPEGTQSELMHHFADPTFQGRSSTQVLSFPPAYFDPVGDLTADTFTWTFSSNRNWGESTNTAVILDPVKGEPVKGPGTAGIVDDLGVVLPGAGVPVFRDWELHIENWGGEDIAVANLEFVWHGKPIAAPSRYFTFDPLFPPGTPADPVTLQSGQNAWDQRWLLDQSNPLLTPPVIDPVFGWEVPMAQRIQGTIGIDNNGDDVFNFDRYIQEVNPLRVNTYDELLPLSDDIIRRPDFDDLNRNGIFDLGTDIPNQEEFASNVVVSLYRVLENGQVDFTPTAYFLTGADGNFYFDVDPTFEWVVRIHDPLGRDVMTADDDPTPPNYMQHYQAEWRITPDWFFAPDRDNDIFNNPDIFDDNNQQFKPGEVFWQDAADPANIDANGDGIKTSGPVPFRFVMGFDTDQALPIIGPPIPMAVKNINFLLEAPATAEVFTVQGTVFADLNGNDVFDGDDARMPNISVYWDANRNGTYDNTEVTVFTDSDGEYTLPVPATAPGTFSVGVRLPGPFWEFNEPNDGASEVFLPEFPIEVRNFALTAPTEAFPDNPPPGAQGRILGVVFNDLDKDGIRDLDEPGLNGVRVFIDSNQNGSWQEFGPDAEPFAITAINGSYVFDNVTPGNDIWVDVHIPNEGTPDATLDLTTPLLHRVVAIGTGGTVTNVLFGAENRAGSDWGDLPDTYKTTSGGVPIGPSHFVIAGFRLGSNIDGEVDGIVSTFAEGDDLTGGADDGVVIRSNGGNLQAGTNTFDVTVFGVGGRLTGWIDWNDDGDFEDIGEQLLWSDNGAAPTAEADLPPGTTRLVATSPGAVVDPAPGTRAARFRWGEPGLSFTGPANRGEVEDYYLPFGWLLGDYNRSGMVTIADFDTWRANFGNTGIQNADGNANSEVDAADFVIWRQHFPGPGGGGEVAFAAQSQGGDSSSTTTDSPVVTEGEERAASAGPPADTFQSSLSGSKLTVFADRVQNASSSFKTSSFVAAQSTAGDSGESQLESDLLLLDQAWADIDATAYAEVDDAISSDAGGDEEHVSDLALAAVFNDENDWRDSF
jgi:hypothetical protein